MSHIVMERLKMRAVSRLNSQLAGPTLAWDRKKRADFARTSKLIANLEMADLDDRLVDRVDDFVLWSFHLEVSKIGYSRCPDIGMVAIQYIAVFSQDCMLNPQTIDFIFT